MAENRGKIRINLTKSFPEGFHADNPEDMMRLTRMIQEKASENPKYEGYLIDSIDPDGTGAVIAPMALNVDNVAEIQRLAAKGYAHAAEIDSADCADPYSQSKTVKRWEINLTNDTDDPTIQHVAGMTWKVIDFINRTNSKSVVIAQLLDEKTISVRQQFADALGIARYPWLVRVSRTAEGGWKICIKGNAVTYRPSRHDARLQETVESIGAPGWFFRADAANGVITVFPGVLPTFKPMVGMPKRLWSKPDVRRSWFGMKLPEKGRETGDALSNDWKNASFVLVCGETGGGKSVVIDSLIYGRIIAGAELYIGDEAGKSSDYNWCRPYVAANGWGADGLESTAAMLLQVLLKVDERARIWKEHGWVNWWELPDDMKKEYPPILLVMDEISQLDVPARLPSGLDKDNPDLIRKKYENAVKFSIQESMLQIVQKARYVGVTGIYASQSATQDAGIPPIMRNNLQSKIIVGEKVPEMTRKSVLKDPRNAPTVPLNVISEGVGKGTGVAELVGQEACVYKGYYEEAAGKSWVDLLRERAERIRPVEADMDAGHLDWATIVDLFPTAAGKPDDGSMYADDGGEDNPPSRLDTEGGFGVDGRDVADHDAPLKGAAKASHNMRISGIQSAQNIAVQSSRIGL